MRGGGLVHAQLRSDRPCAMAYGQSAPSRRSVDDARFEFRRGGLFSFLHCLVVVPAAVIDGRLDLALEINRLARLGRETLSREGVDRRCLVMHTNGHFLPPCSSTSV